ADRKRGAQISDFAQGNKRSRSATGGQRVWVGASRRFDGGDRVWEIFGAAGAGEVRAGGCAADVGDGGAGGGPRLYQRGAAGFWRRQQRHRGSGLGRFAGVSGEVL